MHFNLYAQGHLPPQPHHPVSHQQLLPLNPVIKKKKQQSQTKTNITRPTSPFRLSEDEDEPIEDDDIHFDDGSSSHGSSTSPTNPPSKSHDTTTTTIIKPVCQKRRKELHRRHSKRYRENLGELFQELEELLHNLLREKKRKNNSGKGGGLIKLKTKSQIISATVDAIKLLKGQVADLELKTIMRCQDSCVGWVQGVVRNARRFEQAMGPFVRLLCRAGGWKFGEVWSVDADGKGAMTIFDTFSVFDDGLGGVPEVIKGYKEIVEELVVGEGDWGLMSRVCRSLRSEVVRLDGLDSGVLGGVRHQDLARAAGFKVGFAVPLLLRGRVEAVMVLYDTQERIDLSGAVALVKSLASSIGNCYGSIKNEKGENIVFADGKQKVEQEIILLGDWNEKGEHENIVLGDGQQNRNHVKTELEPLGALLVDDAELASALY